MKFILLFLLICFYVLSIDSQFFFDILCFLVTDEGSGQGQKYLKDENKLKIGVDEENVASGTVSL